LFAGRVEDGGGKAQISGKGLSAMRMPSAAFWKAK
jgi:hypothetical protein